MKTKLRLISFLLVLTGIMMFSGCAENQSSDSSKTSSNSDTSSSASEENSGMQFENDAPLPDGSTDFVIGDDQRGFPSRCDMKLSNGSGDYIFYQACLYYYDYETQTVMPLCSKPDCDHDVDANDCECDAYFPDGIYYYGKGLAYYDDSIYLLGKSSKDGDELSTAKGTGFSVSLYKISKTGSTREEVCRLFDITDENTIGVFAVHRGYAFWSINTEDGTALYSMSLDDKENVKTVYKLDKTAAYIMDCYGAGDSVYFSDTYFLDEEFTESTGEICRYDFKTDKLYKLLDTNANYTIADDRLFYLDSALSPKKIYSCTLDGKNVQEVADCPDYSYHMFSDDNYLYLSNYDNGKKVKSSDYKITVMSFDGEVVDTISAANCESIYGATQGYIYMSRDWQELVLDKNQIGKDKKEWDTIYTIKVDPDTGIQTDFILN